MITTYRRVYPILLVAVLLVSCAMVVPPGETFLTARADFTQRLRWHDYPGAGRYLEPQHQSAFLEAYRGDEDLRFVAVQPQSVDFSEDNRRAETVTLVEYYRLPSVVVRKYRLRQEWRYRQGEGMKQGVWQITSSFPELP